MSPLNIAIALLAALYVQQVCLAQNPASDGRGDLKLVEALPDPDRIKNVQLTPTLPGSDRHQALDETKFRALMATAPPIDPEDPSVRGWAYSPWYGGSFSTPEGKYTFSLYLGGRGLLVTPDGTRGLFAFKLLGQVQGAGDEAPEPADEPAVPRRVEVVAQVHLPVDMAGRISWVAVSPRGNWVAVIVRIDDPEPEDRMLLYAVEEGTARLLPSLLKEDEMPEVVAFDDAGGRLLVGSTTRRMERSLRAWELPQQEEIYSESMGLQSVRSVFTADSAHVVRPHRRPRAPSVAFEVVRLADAEVVREFHVGPDQLMFGGFVGFRLSPDATAMVARQSDWVVGWARPGQPTLLWQWKGTGGIADVALLPEALRAVALMQDGTVVTFDIATGQVLGQLRLDLPDLDPDAPRQRPLLTDWSLHNGVFTDDAQFVLRGNRGSISVWSIDGVRRQDVELPLDRLEPHMTRMRGEFLPASTSRQGPVHPATHQGAGVGAA